MTDETITLADGTVVAYPLSEKTLMALWDHLAAESRARQDAEERRADVGGGMTETSIIDRLLQLLKLSQFISATTAKELQSERHLWQAIARAAGLHLLQGDSRPIWVALEAARAAGLTWEEEEKTELATAIANRVARDRWFGSLRQSR